jgi:hypothetical protein
MNFFWDERYRFSYYSFRTEPNKFIKETLLELYLKGKALFPAVVEGRNAFFEAETVLELTEFETSLEDRNKALKLATKIMLI